MPLAPRTLVEYRAALKRLGAPVSEHTSFSDLASQGALPQVVERNQWQHLSNSARLVLRAAIRWAYAEAGQVDEGVRVANTIQLDREVRKIKKYPTRDDVDRFIARAKDLSSPKRELLLFDVALGLRREELLMLPREAVENAVRGDKVLKFVRKGQVEHELPAAHVEKQLRVLLRHPCMLGREARLGVEAGEWEFLYQVLGATFRSAYDKLRRLVASTAKSAGCSTHWTPHVMRHAFATELIRDGADLTVVQKALNHASFQTTQRYVHIDAADIAPWLKSRGD